MQPFDTNSQPSQPTPPPPPPAGAPVNPVFVPMTQATPQGIPTWVKVLIGVGAVFVLIPVALLGTCFVLLSGSGI